MKLGIVLIIVATFVIYSWLHTYIYGGDTIAAGLTMVFVMLPCLLIGIGRIKKYRKKQCE